MKYKRFVPVGRVALVTYGPHTGKLAVIVDVADQNRLLLTGPTTGVPRNLYNIKHIQLVNQVIKIGRNARNSSVKAAIIKEKVAENFAASTWGKKLARAAVRATATDFDRFAVSVARTKRTKLSFPEYKKARANFLKTAAPKK